MKDTIYLYFIYSDWSVYINIVVNQLTQIHHFSGLPDAKWLDILQVNHHWSVCLLYYNDQQSVSLLSLLSSLSFIFSASFPSYYTNECDMYYLYDWTVMNLFILYISNRLFFFILSYFFSFVLFINEQ